MEAKNETDEIGRLQSFIFGDNKKMKIKNFVLGFGILVIYALALWQGITAFYPAPEYEDFCDSREVPRLFGREGPIDCGFSQELRNKEQACWDAKGEFRYDYDENGCPVDGYCDGCRISYDEARDKYSRNVFIISLVIAVITFVVGFSVLSVEPVGSALLASGVWAVFFGTVINWRNFSNSIRFVLLFIVLVVLIWIALRLNKKKKGKP